jgi:hypothetical protein
MYQKQLRRASGTKETPTRATLIAQYWVRAVIIDGIGAVLKVCAMIEETLIEFEIYCANRRASILLHCLVSILCNIPSAAGLSPWLAQQEQCLRFCCSYKFQIFKCLVGFEVLTAVSMKMAVFWV